MLVAFHSSPFSAPLQSNIPNRGFELDVDMFFVDSDSHDYAQGTKGICEFNINASNTGELDFFLYLQLNAPQCVHMYTYICCTRIYLRY